MRISLFQKLGQISDHNLDLRAQCLLLRLLLVERIIYQRQLSLLLHARIHSLSQLLLRLFLKFVDRIPNILLKIVPLKLMLNDHLLDLLRQGFLLCFELILLKLVVAEHLFNFLLLHFGNVFDA